MNFSERMDALSNNQLFNTGGWATVLSFFSINLSNFTNLTNINAIIVLVIGIFSLLWLIMRMYLTFIQTQREKRYLEDIIENLLCENKDCDKRKNPAKRK